MYELILEAQQELLRGRYGSAFDVLVREMRAWSGRYAAAKYGRNHADDLAADALSGLPEDVREYDPGRSQNAQSYLRCRAGQRMTRAFAKYVDAQPQVDVRRLWRDLRDHENRHEAIHGEAPTVDELARLANVSSARVAAYRERPRLVAQPGEEDGGAPVDPGENPEEVLAAREAREQIAKRARETPLARLAPAPRREVIRRAQSRGTPPEQYWSEMVRRVTDGNT